MVTPQEPKKEKTLHELEQDAITLAKQDKNLTEQIESLIESRNKIRKERRAIEGKITTARINAEA